MLFLRLRSVSFVTSLKLLVRLLLKERMFKYSFELDREYYYARSFELKGALRLKKGFVKHAEKVTLSMSFVKPAQAHRVECKFPQMKLVQVDCLDAPAEHVRTKPAKESLTLKTSSDKEYEECYFVMSPYDTSASMELVGQAMRLTARLDGKGKVVELTSAPLFFTSSCIEAEFTSPRDESSDLGIPDYYLLQRALSVGNQAKLRYIHSLKGTRAGGLGPLPGMHIEAKLLHRFKEVSLPSHSDGGRLITFHTVPGSQYHAASYSRLNSNGDTKTAIMGVSGEFLRQLHEKTNFRLMLFVR